MTQTVNNNNNKTVKFLYSYGGKIIPRPSDGKLRYLGGFTRVLSVDRSLTFSELMVKFGEACGSSMNLTCKLPNEDLDVLITIKSDEDLRNVIEEYERDAPDTKIRAVLFPIKSVMKKVTSPPVSPMSCFDFPSFRKQIPARCCVQPPAAFGYPVAVKNRCYQGRNQRLIYQIALRNRFSH